MAGKRIQPKNLTGGEKLTCIIDEVFLAYNSARLKEACQLFAETHARARRDHRHEPLWRAHARGPRLLQHHPAHQSRVRGLDRLHRRESLPRPALCAELPGPCGSFKFDDTDLRDNDLVRIYDVVIPYSDGLMATDDLLREMF